MVLVILIILFTVFSSYPISAEDVLKNTTAVPIDHAVTDGEHFVNNLVHGQKLNSMPDYLLFTAPYRLCGGECQGKDDNFAMVFPLFVGNKGKAKYKEMYQRDYKNLLQKGLRAPFRVKTTRRPYTLCPTLKSTEETTTTTPVETTTTTPVEPTTTTPVETTTTTPVKTTTTTPVETTTTSPVETTTTTSVETTTTTPVETTTTTPVETTTTTPMATTTTIPVEPTTTTSVQTTITTTVETTTTTPMETTTTTPVEPTTTTPVATTTEFIALPTSSEIFSNIPRCPNIPPGMCKYRNSNKVTSTGKIETLPEAEPQENDYDLTSSKNLQRTRKYSISTVPDYLYDLY